MNEQRYTSYLWSIPISSRLNKSSPFCDNWIILQNINVISHLKMIFLIDISSSYFFLFSEWFLFEWVKSGWKITKAEKKDSNPFCLHGDKNSCTLHTFEIKLSFNSWNSLVYSRQQLHDISPRVCSVISQRWKPVYSAVKTLEINC